MSYFWFVEEKWIWRLWRILMSLRSTSRSGISCFMRKGKRLMRSNRGRGWRGNLKSKRSMRRMWKRFIILGKGLFKTLKWKRKWSRRRLWNLWKRLKGWRKRLKRGRSKGGLLLWLRRKKKRDTCFNSSIKKRRDLKKRSWV